MRAITAASGEQFWTGGRYFYECCEHIARLKPERRGIRMMIYEEDAGCRFGCNDRCRDGESAGKDKKLGFSRLKSI